MLRTEKIIPLIVIVFTLAASAYISSTIAEFRNVPFPWDSAGHAYEGLRIAQDLKTGDLISFLADTYRQAFWPFVHSWLLAPAFLLFGETYATARIVSLFCLILFVPTIYLTALAFSEKNGHWTALILIFLTLTSLPIIVLSSMSMSEVPGLLMTFTTLLFYLKAINRQKPYLFISTSILLAFTLFTKWHHGVFLIPAVFITNLILNKKATSRTNYYLFAPFAVLMIGWFIYPQHIFSFYEHSTFQPHFYKFLTFENWLFYPKSFLSVYHSSLFYSIPIACAFIYSLKRIKDPKTFLLAAHIFIGILLLTIKLDNRHRYIITIVPSIWLLGATQLVEFGYSLKNRVKTNQMNIALSLIIILFLSTISFLTVPNLYAKYPVSLSKYNFYADDKPNQAYEFISRNAANHNHIAVFGTWDYYNSLQSSTIRWHIELSKQNSLIDENAKKRKAILYFTRLLRNRNTKAYKDFIAFLENKDVAIYEYHLLSFMNHLDSVAYAEYRKNNMINPFTDKIADLTAFSPKVTCMITICHDKEQRLTLFTENFFSSQGEWILFNRSQFPDLGITVSLYRLNSVSLSD